MPCIAAIPIAMAVVHKTAVWERHHTARYPNGVDLIPPAIASSDKFDRGQWEQMARETALSLQHWTIGIALASALVMAALYVRRRFFAPAAPRSRLGARGHPRPGRHASGRRLTLPGDLRAQAQASAGAIRLSEDRNHGMRLRTIPLLVLDHRCDRRCRRLDRQAPGCRTVAPLVVDASKPWNALVSVSRRGRPLDGLRAFVTLTGPRGIVRVKADDLGGGRYRFHVHLQYGGFYSYALARRAAMSSSAAPSTRSRGPSAIVNRVNDMPRTHRPTP